MRLIIPAVADPKTSGSKVVVVDDDDDEEEDDDESSDLISQLDQEPSLVRLISGREISVLVLESFAYHKTSRFHYRKTRCIRNTVYKEFEKEKEPNLSLCRFLLFSTTVILFNITDR